MIYALWTAIFFLFVLQVCGIIRGGANMEIRDDNWRQIQRAIQDLRSFRQKAIEKFRVLGQTIE